MKPRRPQSGGEPITQWCPHGRPDTKWTGWEKWRPHRRYCQCCGGVKYWVPDWGYDEEWCPVCLDVEHKIIRR